MDWFLEDKEIARELMNQKLVFAPSEIGLKTYLENHNDGRPNLFMEAVQQKSLHKYLGRSSLQKTKKSKSKFLKINDAI